MELCIKSWTKFLTPVDVQNVILKIDEVRSKLKEFNRALVFIIDQTNNLIATFLTSLVEFIQKGLFLSHLVVISGSANNEIELFQKVPEIVRLPFSEQELKTFIVLHRPKDDYPEWCNKQTISQILGITGAVTIEINRFVNGVSKNQVQISPESTLSERFYKYKTIYEDDYNIAILQKWFKKQKDEKNDKSALENIQRLNLISYNFAFFSK